MAASLPSLSTLVHSLLIMGIGVSLALGDRCADAQPVAPLSAALRIPSPEGKNVAFGGALAGRAGKVVVGAGNLIGSGPVHVIDGTTGAVLLTIANPSPAIDDGFGFAVAWVGDDVLVGAPRADVAGTDRGAAYLFDGASGALLHTLTRPDPVDGWFGFSVAGLGDDALVGVSGLLGPNGEGAYLFDGASGAHLQSFNDPNANTPLAGRFGRTVVVDGSDVLIASSFGASAVYRFDPAGTLLQTYDDPEPADDEEFGSAIAVILTRVAIGEGISTDGEVHLFDKASGALQHTYAPPFVSDNLFFGMSLGVFADNVAIGSANGVYVYQAYPSFGPIQTLHAPAPYSDDRDSFGRSVAQLDDGLAVGAFATTYVFDTCGNGVRTPREQCDDGNFVNGDGCSGACALETCGTAPAVGCVAATKSQLSLRKEHGIYGIKDALKWTWSGAGVDLGDPTTAADWSLCVYDRTETMAPRLRMQPAMLAGGTCAGRPCWKLLGASGYRYGDKERTPSGIAKASFKTAGSGAKVTILGSGPDLGVPEALGETLTLDGQLTVQLRSSTTLVCIGADFPLPALVDGKGKYKDKTN